MVQLGLKGVSAKKKKWDLWLKRNCVPGWKVQVIVRKSGAQAGGHTLKFRAPNGLTFASGKKVAHYDKVIRAAHAARARADARV